MVANHPQKGELPQTRWDEWENMIHATGLKTVELRDKNAAVTHVWRRGDWPSEKNYSYWRNTGAEAGFIQG